MSRNGANSRRRWAFPWSSSPWGRPKDPGMEMGWTLLRTVWGPRYGCRWSSVCANRFLANGRFQEAVCAPTIRWSNPRMPRWNRPRRFIRDISSSCIRLAIRHARTEGCRWYPSCTGRWSEERMRKRNPSRATTSNGSPSIICRNLLSTIVPSSTTP